jgi:glycosyltransferase involved in cell wall biosynthesis
MTLPPRVSVIMPFLDVAPYLGEAIESVVAQTYDRWELLLVDDGSTDGSTEMARAHAARDPERVCYLRHDERASRGASAARNFGLAHARGEFIALLDGDDVWLPHKLEQQVALLDAHPEVGMVYGNTEWWYSWDSQADRGADWVPPLGFSPGSIVPPPELLRRFMAGGAAVPATCSVLIRRAAVDATGGFEEEFRQVFTDHAFYTKLLLSTTVLVTDGCWDRYRRRSGSSYSRIEGTREFAEKRYGWLLWCREYLMEQGWEGTELWETLRHQLARYRRPRAHAARDRVRKLPRRTKAVIRGIARRVVPPRTRHWLRVHWVRRRRPRPGEVDYGSFNRVTPIRRVFDPPRGTPVDEFYVDDFLRSWEPFPPGPVLDLARESPPESMGAGAFAVVIVRDLPPGGPDLATRLRYAYELLRPGGLLLGAFPGIGRFGPGEVKHGAAAFTLAGVRRAAEHVPTAVRVETRGNVLAACGLLHGLSAEELGPHRLGYRDSSFPVVILLSTAKEEGTR